MKEQFEKAKMTKMPLVVLKTRAKYAHIHCRSKESPQKIAI